MKYFKYHEFDVHCRATQEKKAACYDQNQVCQGCQIAGIPFKINSGFRTPEHNEKVGGAESSSHLRGHAADIHVSSSTYRYEILSALLEAGFTRIGIAKNFIHVDNDPIKTQNVIWTYA